MECAWFGERAAREHVAQEREWLRGELHEHARALGREQRRVEGVVRLCRAGYTPS
jgi:hypothetical protein